jgi:CubicO group peptidase (beta-lactamase class C family)
MTTFVHKNDLPGAALAVAKDGRVVYSRGFGFADREKKEPVRPNSLFRIASISKPITAAAILQLVERKKLKLDDKVFEVLELVEPNGAKFDGRWKKVTILQRNRSPFNPKLAQLKAESSPSMRSWTDRRVQDVENGMLALPRWSERCKRCSSGFLNWKRG